MTDDKQVLDKITDITLDISDLMRERDLNPGEVLLCSSHLITSIVDAIVKTAPPNSLDVVGEVVRGTVNTLNKSIKGI